MTRPVIRMISRRPRDRLGDIVARRVLQVLQKGRYSFRRESLEIVCADKTHITRRDTIEEVTSALHIVFIFPSNVDSRIFHDVFYWQTDAMEFHL